MNNAIFLSAGVPDPRRSPEFAATADTVAITAAVSALIHVVLGRRPLVWGGQPAITPMILVVADAVGIQYGDWVRLYQSRFFEDEFPEDNARFANVTFTDATLDDREASLRSMRERMFSDVQFSAAVFIGGMKGIVDEYELFHRLQPEAQIFPIASTGGAALEVVKRVGGADIAADDERDYVALFHRLLDISVRERRFPTLKAQPSKVADRFWRPGDRG
jgi:hypothetical protein